MSYKEGHPKTNKKKVIRHGPNRGAIDMSGDPSKVNISKGGQVDITDLVQTFDQERPPIPKKRTRRY